MGGKAAGLPIFRLLGAENKPVFTYATGGYYVEGEKLTACADELAGFVANGFKAVKLKTGAGALENEVARIRATREAIGHDVKLMLDMNGAYDLHDCIAFARVVEPYDITWLEALNCALAIGLSVPLTDTVSADGWLTPLSLFLRLIVHDRACAKSLTVLPFASLHSSWYGPARIRGP